MSYTSIIKRLSAMQAAVAPGSKTVQEAFTRTGIILTSEIKLNIRRQGLIDTGRLLNSIRYEMEQSAGRAILRVGSFGVPYAAAHEFGDHRTHSVRAYSRSSLNGSMFSVRAHDRRANIPARPYLKPAIEKHRKRIVDLLREAARGE